MLGIGCFLYTILLVSYAGPKVSFLGIWPLLGIFFCGLWWASVYVPRMVPRLEKLLFILYFVLFLGGILFGMLEGVLLHSGNKQPEKNAQYILVLGAKVNGTVVSRALRYRLDTAMEYLEENPDTKVIVSGGRGAGEDITEAEAMKRYLVDHGVLEERIIKEEKSVNTDQNIEYSRQIIGDSGEKVVIVTNHFHVFRSVAIAEKQGLQKVSGMPAKTDRIMGLHYYVREAFAVVKYKCMGRI